MQEGSKVGRNLLNSLFSDFETKLVNFCHTFQCIEVSRKEFWEWK